MAQPQPLVVQPGTFQPLGSFQATPSGQTIAGIIRNTVHFPFRKVEIKRRQDSDGLYEANWFDITKFVTRFGSLQTSVDDERINQFVHSGVQLSVRNDWGEFNPEHDGGSLFFGFLTRYRTKVRVSAGYTDGSGNSFPSVTTQGVFILDGEIISNVPKNDTSLKCKSIISPFEETRANEVTGITSSMTSSEIMEKIRDASDGSGNVLFRQWISASSWDITPTTNIITGLGTSTSLDDFTTWDLMNQLAEVEGFVVNATREGGLVFGNRNPNTDTSQFSLYGSGYRRPNIIKFRSAKEAVNKLFTFVRFKYLDPDTTTSIVENGTQTVIDPGSLEWKYGRNTLELENTFFSDTATVNRIVAELNNEFSNLRVEAEIDCVFLPQIEILDRVDVSYREGSLNSVMLWDMKTWSSDTASDIDPGRLVWASETSSTIDYSKKNFKVISRKTNLDTFVTTLKLREVEN